MNTIRYWLRIALSITLLSATGLRAQDANSPEQVLTRVGNYVIAQTSNLVIDKTTNAVIANLDTMSVNKNAVYKSAFNDWVYPNGVMLYGMMRAGEIDAAYQKFLNYGLNNFSLVFNNYTYFKKLYASYKITSGNNCYKLYRMSSLDDCGAMGAALIEAYNLSTAKNSNWLQTINAIANYISTGQIRLSDGTLYRIGPSKATIWGDDLYMSVPCIIRMGELTGEKKYYEDAVKQVLQFYKRLLQPDRGITHHGYYADSLKPSLAYWGRANGWMMVAAIEAYGKLPATQNNRDSVLMFIKAHINGVLKYQDSTTGLWHQLIDKKDSFLETSCTAMFTYSIARAVNEGWLDTSYAAYARKGWSGVASKVLSDGQIQGTCQGTSMSEDLSYYYNRLAPVNDPHAFGPVLLAAGEMVRLQKKSITTGLNEKTAPERCTVEQNYPNPFNPATVIKFQITAKQLVVLKVYDTLGKEVTTLVNGVKPAGVYECRFNGGQLASGLYMYTLKTGNTSQTKKMILIK